MGKGGYFSRSFHCYFVGKYFNKSFDITICLIAVVSNMPQNYIHLGILKDLSAICWFLEKKFTPNLMQFSLFSMANMAMQQQKTALMDVLMA